MITKEQLKNEIDTVDDKQTLELVYQLIQNLKNSSMTAKPVKNHNKEEQQKAMSEFCGMFDDLPIDSVEDTMRLIRKGRRRLWDDI